MIEDFYRAILPDVGQYCIFILSRRQHVWVDSIEELASLSADLVDKEGIYFGTASFDGANKRQQANVLALKSLRLDLDAGPEKLAKHGIEKVYATQQDAIAAVVKMSKDAKLPPSYIVSSGHGLHIYYALDADLTRSEWQPLAKGLARLCIQHGLKADTSVTEDSARILRPPGGLHSGNVRVKILKATGMVYSQDKLQSLLQAADEPPKRSRMASLSEDIVSGFEGPPSSALKIVQHCGALREVAVSKGEVPEPQWRAMLGLVKRCVEGRDIAHEWSHGHPDYDTEDTDRKFDGWAAGPTTCIEFERHSDACKTCEYKGRVKSPISLGLMTTPEIEQLPEDQKPLPVVTLEPVANGSPWDNCMPAKFSVIKSAQGLTLMNSMLTEKASETGDLVPVTVTVAITHDIFWFGQWAEAEDSTDTAKVTLHKWDGNAVKTYLLDQTLMASRSDLMKFLAGKAIHLTNDKRAPLAMENYAKQQLLRIKHMARRPKVTDRFGLRILDDGKLVCAHGKYVIYPDGVIHEAMLGASLQGWSEQFPIPIPKSFSGEWSADVWDSHVIPKAKLHVDFMKRHYGRPGLEKYQLAFMMALASPLMAFVTGAYASGPKLPPNGLSVSLYSREGGRGKTTLMQSAMLSFGVPGELSKDQNKVGSTDLARVAKLSMSGTMPVAMDEMGSNGEKSTAELISAISNGSGRDRATKDGGLTSSARWALICLIATNRSQRDMVAATTEESSAIQYRLLELDVDGIAEFDQDARAKFTLEWAEVAQQCAGALGALIHREICALGAEAANKLVLDCVNKASDLVGADQTGRFQYRALGAVLAMQSLLTRLGLDVFPLKSMVEEFRIAHDSAQTYVKQNILPTNGLELLSIMLHDLRPHTVITQDETRRGRNSTGYDTPMNQMPVDVRVRHVVSTSTSYVSVATVREWCVSKHIRDTNIIRDASTRNVLMLHAHSNGKTGSDSVNRNSSMYNLLKGMRESTGSQMRCYAFSVHRLGQLLGEDIGADMLTDSNVVPLNARPTPPLLEAPTGT